MLSGFQTVFLCAVPLQPETGSPSSPVCRHSRVYDCTNEQPFWLIGLWWEALGHRDKGQTKGRVRSMFSPLKTWHILLGDLLSNRRPSLLGSLTLIVVGVWLRLGVLQLHVGSPKERCAEVEVAWKGETVTQIKSVWICLERAFVLSMLWMLFWDSVYLLRVISSINNQLTPALSSLNVYFD